MKDCWVTSNKLRNGSAGWPLRPGKVAVLTAHQWPLPRALCTATMLILLSHKSGPRNYLLSALLSYHSSPMNAKNAVMTTGGYGLGMSIAQSIVAVHKGKIRAECPGENVLMISVTLPL